MTPDPSQRHLRVLAALAALSDEEADRRGAMVGLEGWARSREASVESRRAR
jgi:hypothetical protein